jgi:(p)ppGpp synthase/HD superfamily hydrolase
MTFSNEIGMFQVQRLYALKKRQLRRVFLYTRKSLTKVSQLWEDLNNMSVRDIIRAADFAAKKHSRQRRKDPEATPYINHPLGVAAILTEEGGVEDPIVLIAAILHDTVEDSDATFEDIEALFGPTVER